MITQELKARWLEALRSGKYRKGRGALRYMDNNSYCCLGVLCDIKDPTQWSTASKMVGCFSYSGCTLLPSVHMFETADHFDYQILHNQLIELCMLNDNNDTWDEVIAYIEKNI